MFVYQWFAQMAQMNLPHCDEWLIIMEPSSFLLNLFSLNYSI